MKLAPSPLVISIIVVAAAAGIAAADRVVLHSGDSMTIDGKVYACDDATTAGTNLAIGDKLTVGAHDLRCKAAGGGDHAPAAAPPVAVESRVDGACINELFHTIDGSPAPADAIRWADACRPFEIGKQCTVTSSAADEECFGFLNQVISGSFSERDAARAQGSCKVIDATCPALPTAAESKVDMDCVNNLYQRTSGKPDGPTILRWLEQCRDRPVGACTIVGGTNDEACVSSAFSMITGHFTAADAGTAARRCRTLELSCP